MGDANTTVTNANDLEGFLRTRRDNWESNRLPLQTKMEQNHRDFRGLFDPDLDATWKKGEGSKWRSRAFITKTRQKVMSCYSILIDVMMQRGRIPFNLKMSPMDNIRLEDLPEDAAQQVRDRMREQRELIEQQFIDTHTDRAFMKAVQSMCVYGEAYGKRIMVDVERTGFRAIGSQSGAELLALMDPSVPVEEFTTLIPTQGVDYVSPWDIFRDLEDDDLQMNAGFFHTQLHSPYWLRQKKHEPLWINSQIKLALKEAQPKGSPASPGIKTTALAPWLRQFSFRENTISVAEFWGRAPRKHVEDFEKRMSMIEGSGIESVPPPQSDTNAADDIDGDEVEIMAVLTGNQITRFVRRPPAHRPLYRIVCEENIDELGAVGVADNTHGAQEVVNGATRAYIDNKRLAGDLILAVQEHMLEKPLPENVEPGMKINVDPSVDDARKAVVPITFPDTGARYADVMQIFLDFLDDASMIPRIAQGLKPGGDPTAFQINEQETNSTKYIGGIVKNIDEGWIEPSVSDAMRHNITDPDQPRGKGNFVGEAQGFAAFNERIVIARNIMRMMNVVSANDEMSGETNFRYLLERLNDALLSGDEKVLKTDAQKEQEAKDQENSVNAQITQLELKEREVKIQSEQIDAQVKLGKLQLETQKAAGDAERAEEKLALERAETVAKIEDGKKKGANADNA